MGGAAMVRIQLTNKRGIPVEPFQVNRGTGRIVLRNEGVTVGAGKYIPIRKIRLMTIGVVTSLE
jgi:translation elongation factor EF-1alpha